jgi:hypothetical protein
MGGFSDLVESVSATGLAQANASDGVAPGPAIPTAATPYLGDWLLLSRVDAGDESRSQVVTLRSAHKQFRSKGLRVVIAGEVPAELAYDWRFEDIPLLTDKPGDVGDALPSTMLVSPLEQANRKEPTRTVTVSRDARRRQPFIAPGRGRRRPRGHDVVRPLTASIAGVLRKEASRACDTAHTSPGAWRLAEPRWRRCCRHTRSRSRRSRDEARAFAAITTRRPDSPRAPYPLGDDHAMEKHSTRRGCKKCC